MTSYSLPWTIGPLPILLTLWSAFVCIQTFAHKMPMNGARFAAALVFPVGLTSAASQIFFSEYNQLLLLVANQAIGSMFCFVFSLVAKNRRSDGMTNSKTKVKSVKLAQNAFILLCVYVAVNGAITLIPSSDSCTIAKCFVLESVFGRRDQVFAILYMVSVFESLVLVALFYIFFQIYGNLRGDESLRDL